MRRTLRLLALILPLAACQPSLPQGGASTAVAASPVAGGAITTTTLDAAPVPASDAVAPPRATDAPPPRPETARAAAPPAAEPAPIPAPVATPAPKSAGQIACERKKGSWVRTGEGEVRACVFRTRDGGKRCDAKTDCAGECLARSGTCSPIQPLFGCNAVLTDSGAEVTLCID